MAVLKGRADKKTEEQRGNGAAQKTKPKDIQNTTYVTTGPAAGRADKRDDNPAPPVQEEVPVTIVPSEPADGITDDARDGPGVKR